MASSLDMFDLNKRKPEDVSSTKYVIARREDGKFADESHSPTAKVEDAKVFDSKPLASLWADKMSAGMPGTWEAKEHPGVTDPDGDDYDPVKADAAYRGLPMRRAA